MSKFSQKFIPLSLEKLTEEVSNRKKEQWRFVQLLAVKADENTDLVYSFMKDGNLENLKIESITEKDEVPSITSQYLEAFVYENEIHDLFNIKITNIAIDFEGKFYNLAVDAPMSVVSPEAIARKERQKKVDAALAAKKKKLQEQKKAKQSKDNNDLEGKSE